MQRFVHKVVTHHHPQPNLLLHRIFSHTSSGIAHIHTPKPSHLGHRIPSSFTDHLLHRFHSPWPSYHHTLSAKLITLNPRNALRRTISTLNCRLRLPAFHFCVESQRFSFSRSYDSYRRSWRSWFDSLTPNDIVWALIYANTAVFLLWQIADEKFMINNFTISLDNITSGRLHTLITSVFSHQDIWHIVPNMFGLYFFGMKVGLIFGSELLLRTYQMGAIYGSVTSLGYLLYQAYKAETSKELGFIIRSKEFALGASGAVYAVMLLDIFLFPTTAMTFHVFNTSFPVPMIVLATLVIGTDILRIRMGDSSLAGSAQLGGAAIAASAWAALQVAIFRKRL